MTSFLLGFLLLILLACAYVFYDGFTRRGAIPLAKAWRDFTSWLALAGIALAEYGIALLRYAADLWEPMQVQFGSLLADPSLATFVQVLSFIFMVLKLKAQAPLPRPDFPSIPRV